MFSFSIIFTFSIVYYTALFDIRCHDSPNTREHFLHNIAEDTFTSASNFLLRSIKLPKNDYWHIKVFERVTWMTLQIYIFLRWKHIAICIPNISINVKKLIFFACCCCCALCRIYHFGVLSNFMCNKHLAFHGQNIHRNFFSLLLRKQKILFIHFSFELEELKNLYLFYLHCACDKENSIKWIRKAFST